MQPISSGISTLALLLVATSLGLAGPAVAQQSATGDGQAPFAAKADNDGSMSTSEPDPLTPKPVEQGPAVAPGAPAAAAAKPEIEADVIVKAVRQSLGTVAPAGAATGEAAERAAIAAFYAEGTGRAIWTGPEGLTAKGRAATGEMQRAADWGLEPAAFAGPFDLSAGASPETAAAVEVRIAAAVLKYARHARGGRVDPNSLSKSIDRQVRLFEPRSVLDAIAAAADADAYMRGLHPQHEQFRRLQKALVDARADTKSRPDAIQRIVVNMERWRWMPDDLGEFHVWDNVPEQMTRVFRDGKVVLTERIVVGKPTQQTPEFSAPMKYVIFHPTWGVPDGIKTNELGPLLRRASGGGGGWFFGGGGSGAQRVLERHELRVSHNGRPVNPDNVDWNRVDIRQFQFTQPPSGKNVLGIVKFRFPNKFDVYMHDTQDKQLFSHATRAYSHGCMRVQNPMRLAEVILAYDKGWASDRVHGFVGRGGTSDITLDKQVPVHITYLTARVDDDGKLHMYADLYGRDARVASALAGKTVAIASVAPASAEKERAAAEGDQPAQKSARKGERKREAQRVKSTKQDLGFNPFSLSN